MVYPTEPRKQHTSAFFVFHWSIHTCSLAVSQTDRPKLTPSRRVSGQADRQTPLQARADFSRRDCGLRHGPTASHGHCGTVSGPGRV
jgi:hypothetical protein